MNKYSWTDFKAICRTNFLTMLMEEKNSYYLLLAQNGPVIYRCDLQKDESTDQIDFETNFKANCNKKVIRNDAFVEKTLPNGKKLFRRAHGIQHTLFANSDNIIEFVVPYNWCKITTMEVIGLSEMLKIDLSVMDTPAGTYSTIPNYKLNQFGFNVNASKNYYKDHSEYDADLYLGMIVKIVIKNNTTNTETIGINFTLHEVV